MAGNLFLHLGRKWKEVWCGDEPLDRQKKAIIMEFKVWVCIWRKEGFGQAKGKAGFLKGMELLKEYPYLYETHLHTSQASACAHCTGAKMAKACKKAGYTGIIVTDHNWGGNTAVNKTLPWKQWVEEFVKGYEDAAQMGERIGLDVPT